MLCGFFSDYQYIIRVTIEIYESDMYQQLSCLAVCVYYYLQQNILRMKIVAFNFNCRTNATYALKNAFRLACTASGLFAQETSVAHKLPE